ncbi:MAG: flavodoxin family protein [Anaerovoracaceae bacterium]
MEKIKVIGICGSPRKGKHTETLMEHIFEGCKAEGAEVEMITIHDKDLKPCTGCLSCQKGGTCPVKDDITKIFEKIKEADGIVMGSPVFFCDVTAQMKMILDRSFAYWPINGNKVGAIATVAGSVGCSGVIDTFNRFFTMHGISSAGFVGLYGKTGDKIKAQDTAYKIGQKIVKQARIQKGTTNGAYDAATHVVYGTHTF